MKTETKTADWRSVIKVHPAAELFPLMSPEDLKALADDIKAHGLSELPAIWKDADGAEWLIDGRNRLDALAAVGGYTFANDPEFRIYHGLDWGTGRQYPHVDPYTFVVSANIHRRHLTTSQKSELIEALLKATPEKSDRAIAETTKTSHVTVAAKRAKLVSGGQIDQVAKRAGRDGKGYTQKKQPSKAKIAAFVTGQPTKAEITAALQKTKVDPATVWNEKATGTPEEQAEEKQEQEQLEKEWARENWEDRVLARVPTVDENVEDSALAGMDEDTKLTVARAAIARIRNEARVLGKLAMPLAQQNWVKGLSGWLGTFERDWAEEKPVENRDDNESATQLAPDRADGSIIGEQVEVVTEKKTVLTDEEALKKLSRMRTERIGRDKRESVGINEPQTDRLVTAGVLKRWPTDETAVERPSYTTISPYTGD